MRATSSAGAYWPATIRSMWLSPTVWMRQPSSPIRRMRSAESALEGKCRWASLVTAWRTCSSSEPETSPPCRWAMGGGGHGGGQLGQRFGHPARAQPQGAGPTDRAVVNLLHVDGGGDGELALDLADGIAEAGADMLVGDHQLQGQVVAVAQAPQHGQHGPEPAALAGKNHDLAGQDELSDVEAGRLEQSTSITAGRPTGQSGHGNESRSTSFGHDQGREELGIPAGHLSGGLDGSPSPAGTQEIEGQPTDEGHVLSAVPASEAGLVLLENEVENPMHAFYAPVVTDGGRRCCSASSTTARGWPVICNGTWPRRPRTSPMACRRPSRSAACRAPP